jgi:hypothetical protein
MLTLSSNRTSGGLRVANRIKVIRTPNITGGTNWGFNDPVAEILESGVYVNESVDPRCFFGTTGSTIYNGPSTWDFKGLKPVPKPYRYNEDVQKYSNALAVGFSGVFLDSGAPSFENQVFHTKGNGSLTMRVSDFYTYKTGRFTTIRTIPVGIPDQAYPLSNGIPWFCTTNHSFPSRFGTIFVNGGGLPLFTKPLEVLLKELPSMFSRISPVPYLSFYQPLGHTPLPLTPVFGFVDSIFTGVADLVVDGPTVSYTLYHAGSSSLRVTKTVLTFSQVLRTNAGGPSSFGRMIYRTHVSRKYECEHFVRVIPLLSEAYYCYKKDGNNNAKTLIGTIESSPTDWDYTFAFSDISAPMPKDSLPDIIREDSVYWKSVQGLFMESFGDFRPSVMYSYADAVGNYRALASNYLEVIAEASELLHLAPELATLFKAYTAITSSGAKLDGVGKLADFFSSTYLLASFGWRPVVSNATELIHKVDNVGQALRKLQSPMTLNGKFTFNLPKWHGYSDIHIEARTKIRLRGVSDSVAIHMLSLDSLGLLPRSSSLWDLVPLSWLIDYVTSLSNRYDVIDSTILGHLLGLDFAVHSVKIRGPITDDVLKSYGVSSSTAEFEIYGREVSRFVPLIFNSNIDFGAPLFSPDKGIIGSLLWQLFRK